MDKRNKKDSIIAAAITFAAALAILLWLFFGGLTFDRANLAASSMPEIQPAEEEELFVEPELIQELGEPDAVTHDEPAPAFKGEPEKAETENTKLVVPGKNEKQTAPVEKPVTQSKPSPVTVTEPPKVNEDQKKVTSKMAGKFSNQNGAQTGTSGTQGAGGTGVGIDGFVSGRRFISCPKPSVALQNKVVVVVNVTINSSGQVTKAIGRTKSGSNNNEKAIVKACEAAAMKARWNEDKDTPSATGTLTFIITPK